MKRILSVFLILLIAVQSFSLIGCTENKTDSGNVIRVCNCEDYIDEDLLAEFEEETGIKVIYSTYGTNENLYNELVINPNSYDLVVPSEYMIEKLAEEGRIQKLNFEKLPDYKNNVSKYIDDRLNNLRFTIKSGEYEGEEVALSEFMVGYMWGTMGWVYDTENVSIEEVKSWTAVFDNPTLNKRITIKDAVRDSYIVGLAMVYGDELRGVNDNATITKILNRVDQASIDKVGEKLASFKEKLYGFEVDSGKNDIINDRIDAYVAWSGDAAYAIDVASGEVEDEDGSFVENASSLSYYIPDEGSNIWFDGFVMPSGSKNYDAVYKFLEFISRPETVYRNMNYTGYTGMVANGEFMMEDEDGTEYETTIFDEILIGWFDESEYLAEELSELPEYEDKSFEEILDIVANFSEEEIIDNGYVLADLKEFEYFFGEISDDYRLIISESSWGRLLAQYPTADIVERCAIMNNFDSETLLSINEMWETVKGETFPLWLILLIVGLVILLAVVMVLYRNKEKIKWFKLPERKTTYAERKGYKILKKENII